MKIAIFNTTDAIGSTGKLAYNLFKYLNENGHVSIIIAGQVEHNPNDGQYCISKSFEHKIDVFLRKLTGLKGCFSILATIRALKILETFSPNIVYFGNMHGDYINIYILYDYLARHKIPIVQIMWDEYPLAGGCTYAYECEKFKSTCGRCSYKREYPDSLIFDTSRKIQKMNKCAYNKANVTFVGVPYTINRCKQSSILKNKRLFELDESVEQEKLYYPRASKNVRKRLGISENDVVLLDVCIFTSKRKGGKYFLELAKKCIDLENITFVHVGFNGNKDDCPKNFIPLGFVHDQNELAEYYSMADLYVCTSFEDTMPNACLEAMSCGTKICGFNISGIPSCAEQPFGEYVEPGNIDQLVDIVRKTRRKTKSDISNVRNYAISRFSSIKYDRSLLELGEDIVNKGEIKNDTF